MRSRRSRCLSDDVLRAMIERGTRIETSCDARLSPDHPVMRGTAQNPDVFFQARETVNPFYAACPEIVQRTMDRFAELTGRRYRLFDYHGATDAERVIVLMGSGCEAVHETVDYLERAGEKSRRAKGAAVSAVRRRSVCESAADDRHKRSPCSIARKSRAAAANRFIWIASTRSTKQGRSDVRIVGGRYGLSSKEFTPAMVKAVFDNLAAQPHRRTISRSAFTTISADTSLDFDPDFSIESRGRVPRAVLRTRRGWHGRRQQGIDQDHRRKHRQLRAGLFCLRFEKGRRDDCLASALRAASDSFDLSYQSGAISSPAINRSFSSRIDVLEHLVPGGTFLLNTPFGPERVWEHCPRMCSSRSSRSARNFFVIDAHKVARECGMGGRINTIMQTCFFAISGVLPHEEAIAAIKDSIRKDLRQERRGDRADESARGRSNARASCTR